MTLSRLVDVLRLRLRSLFRREAVELELDEELHYHLECQIEQNLAAGMDRGEARRAALRAFAGMPQVEEECRDMRGWNSLDNLWKDVRFAIRQLRKNAGFTATAILVLALGISAGLAIFAFVDAALIRPLPYRDPARLVGVFEAIPACPHCNLSYSDYVDWQRRNVVFSSFDAYRTANFSLATPSGPQPARGARVTHGFFATLGVAPILGRDFEPGDNLPASPHTALLTYAVWQNRYAGSRDAVGQTVMLDGQQYAIVGVLPREFHFAPVGTAEFWTAFQPMDTCDQRRSCHGMYGVARLKNGVSIEAALANVQSIARQLQAEYPDSNRDQEAALAPLTDVIVGNIRQILMVLLGGAALLLLIASVNVAGLMVVRSESRRREIAVRTALGASSGRLIGQFLTEGLLLAVSGGLLGLVSAHWGIRLLRSLISQPMRESLPFLSDIGLTGDVIAAAAAVTVLAALFLSAPPCLRVWSRELSSGLAEASRGSAGTAWRRLGSKMVVVELATAMVLLSGAGLLGKSLYRLMHVAIGFTPERLITMDVTLPPGSYNSDGRIVTITRRMVEDLSALPGVRTAGFASLGLPLGGNGNTSWLRVLGRPWHGEHNETPQRDVSPTYLQTLGARLLRGRYFEDSEDRSKPPVAIVNQSFVNRYFPGEDPIGKQLAFLSTPPVPIQIVGVVDNIREGPLDAAIPPVLYIPFNQSPGHGLSLVIRTGQEDGSLLPAVASAIRRIDATILTQHAGTMTERIDDSQSAYLHRTVAWLVGGFAVLALMLGVIGLYGVIVYSVSQRNREIGIRMALGARPGSVYGMVLGEAGRLVAVGTLLGVAGSVASAKLLKELLFGVSAWDAATLAAVAVLLSAAALLAAFLPARRAASVNPVDALRAE